MKIKTQFTLSTLVFCIIFVLTSASFLSTYNEVNRLGQQQEIAANIEQGAHELSYLSNDYLFHPEEQRQNIQWESRFTRLSDDISRLSVDQPDQQALVDRLIANKARLHDVYTQSVAAIEAAKATPGQRVDPELIDVAWSRFIVQNQAMISDAEILVQVLHEEANQVQRINAVLVFLLMGIVLLFLTSNYVFIKRRILRAIAALNAGTTIVGKGNLDFRIDTVHDDEIGELSGAFNQMTASLRAITASKQDLEKEIEERRIAERALRESEQRYHSLFVNMLDGFAFCRMLYDNDEPTDFIYIEVNEAFSQLTGLMDVKGKRVTEVIPGIKDSNPELFAIYGRVAATGVPERFTTYLKPLNEWFSVAVYSPEKGFFVAIFDNITARKQAEDALRETNAYLNNLFDYANAPIITWDPGFQITRFNHAFENLTGRSHEEVLGKTLEILFPDETRHASMALIRKAAIGERWETVEIPILTKEGIIRTVLWNSANVLDPDGRTISTIAQGVDITERKRAEAALQQANKQLNLLSSITRHDILNQLLVLKAYLELSHEEVNNPTTLLEYIAKQEKAANTIERQITFTRDYQEMGAASPAWQDVNASIQKALLGLPMRDIHVEPDPKNPEVFADPLFEKVFYNLIDNALRYGGADMKTIRVSSHEEGASLTIICEDDGVGISGEDKKLLFTKGFGKNTGLGLFLSREILSITGITITENGIPGKGARFEISVPKGGYRFNASSIPAGGPR
jgi:PAS domain S-box-containing protein